MSCKPGMSPGSFIWQVSALNRLPDPKQIESVVRELVGVPYVHAGRDPAAGLDCLGLIHVFYKRFGISVPDGDGAPYERDWFRRDPVRYLRGILQHGKPVDPDDLQPLDFVYFFMGGAVTHAGVMVDSERFIHVLEGRAVSVSRLSSMWRRRLVGARRFV